VGCTYTRECARERVNERNQLTRTCIMHFRAGLPTIHIHKLLYVNIHIGAQACAPNTYIRTYTHIHACNCPPRKGAQYTHTHAYTHVHIHVHTYIHTHIYTCTYVVHIYTYTQERAVHAHYTHTSAHTDTWMRRHFFWFLLLLPVHAPVPHPCACAHGPPCQDQLHQTSVLLPGPEEHRGLAIVSYVHTVFKKTVCLMCACMCVCISIQSHACMYVCMHTYPTVCMHVCVYAYLSSRMHARV